MLDIWNTVISLSIGIIWLEEFRLRCYAAERCWLRLRCPHMTCDPLLRRYYNVSSSLGLALWVKNSADDISKYFSHFFFFFFFFFFVFCFFVFQKTEIDISCKLSPTETICSKCQILSSGEKRKQNHQFVVCWISSKSGKGYIHFKWRGVLCCIFLSGFPSEFITV